MDMNIGLLSDTQNPDKSFSVSRDSLEDNGTPDPSPEAEKPSPMAFTIDFGGGKPVDKSRLEHLAKQSQARHQRVQSMSASLSRTSPTALTPQKAPLSAKLPRKAQGYNSEGYFSSDQEDNFNSSSVKLKQSPLTQSNDFRPHSFSSSPFFDKAKRPLKSPTQKSKSPIVDSIMSRSDILPSRLGLNLPLKNTLTGSYHDLNSVNYNYNYSNRQLNSILDQSPDGILLADISSPELDVMTPDNTAPSPSKSPKREVPDLFKKCIPKNELEILEDIDRHSDNSSTGTYTIEADYSEEQKARMSIDRTFGVDLLKGSLSDPLQRRSLSRERDPELIIDTRETPSPINLKHDSNVLELNCYHETELAEQTSKQIKSTRSYLEKIKNRVRTISEKTFPKKTQDEGSFTSVTASGVFAKNDYSKPRRLSLSKSKIDQTDYVPRLSPDSSNHLSISTPAFESTVLKNAQAKVLDDSGISRSPDSVAGRLSYLSLNRCKGDQNWIRDWAESVDKYYDDGEDADNSFPGCCGDRPPASPRNRTQKVTNLSLRNIISTSTSKIPSPVSSSRQSPRQDINQDTSSYLLKTQNAITNLQAKLITRASPEAALPTNLASSFISDKTAPSKLPVSQLSRSNSLNYRLKRKDLNSPAKSPEHYVITGSAAHAGKLVSTGASRSFDADAKTKADSNMNSPTSDRTMSSDDKTLSQRTYAKHSRHRSFDGKNSNDYFSCDNAKVSLKTVLKNNAFEAQRFDQTAVGCRGDARNGANIKRSSSFSTVNRNNNYIRDDFDCSDESDYVKPPEVRYNRAMALRRERLQSPELKSAVVAPKCPKTPEMARKFGPGSIRNTVRSASKEARPINRVAEAVRIRDKTPSQGKKISEATRAEVFNRLTKSRSSTREVQPKKQEKVADKTRQRCGSSQARELNYANLKKRTSYDPMRAARQAHSHASPVHRSQSFHSSNLATLHLLDYPCDDQQVSSESADPMITSTHSEILRPTLNHTFHINKAEKSNRRDPEKRKTYIVEGIDKRGASSAIDTSTIDKRTIDTRTIDKRTIDKRKQRRDYCRDEDDRKTFILDSDTNSTTNGSSPRNSSIFSHEKVSVTTGPSDTDNESGTDSAPVPRRSDRAASAAYRAGGGWSAPWRSQPRADARRRDAATPRRTPAAIETEQKKAALEQWRRRASYDPRKSAAADKPARQTNKSTSVSVLRSQSFHGPVSSALRLARPQDADDYTSDNDF